MQDAIAGDMPSTMQRSQFRDEAARTGERQLNSAAQSPAADVLGSQLDIQEILTTQPARLPAASSLDEPAVTSLAVAGQLSVFAEDFGLSADQAAGAQQPSDA